MIGVEHELFVSLNEKWSLKGQWLFSVYGVQLWSVEFLFTWQSVRDFGWGGLLSTWMAALNGWVWSVVGLVVVNVWSASFSRVGLEMCKEVVSLICVAIYSGMMGSCPVPDWRLQLHVNQQVRDRAGCKWGKVELIKFPKWQVERMTVIVGSEFEETKEHQVFGLWEP